MFSYYTHIIIFVLAYFNWLTPYIYMRISSTVRLAKFSGIGWH